MSGAFPLRLRVPAGGCVDADPWPRAAPVGPGSAFAAVPEARPVEPLSVEVGRHAEIPPRRSSQLDTWRFAVAGAEDEPPRRADRGSVVRVPESWSRRDPALASFRGPVWYWREVAHRGRYARLVFEGLDYLSRVYVAGDPVVGHEGGFTPVAVDLPAASPLAVAVLVDDPEEPARLDARPGLKAKRKIKGVFEDHDSRPGGMAYGPNYDPASANLWGTGGMTGRALLQETGPVRIDALFATARPGELRLSWVLTNHEHPGPLELLAEVGGAGVRVQADLPEGASRVPVALAVEGEELWSPESPRLYRLRSAAVTGSGTSDSCEARIGFREVQMNFTPPEAFRLHLNGDPVYVRAANYIPGVWPGELPQDTVERDLRLARAAHLNSVGMHAGVFPPALDAADSQGVLVYQDFPLQQAYDAGAGPMHQGGSSFAEASLELAAEMVYTLYNHPSVVYWCGHNEPAYQFTPPEGFDPPPPMKELVDAVRALPDEQALDEERLALLRRLDPSRPSSVASGVGRKRPDSDHHDYSGSIEGGWVDDSCAGSVPFVSEYGAWSANFSAAGDVAAASGPWPPSPGADREWHAATHLPAVQHTRAGRPDRFEDFQHWAFAGQLWAAWYAKLATERARAAKWSPSAGQRWHFLVDHWGPAGGGVLDRHRAPTIAYRALAAANRPLLAVARPPARSRAQPGEVVDLPVVVVNDMRDGHGELHLHWALARLGAGDRWIVGRDDLLGEPDPLLGPAPAGHFALLPVRLGQVVAEGDETIAVLPNSRAQGPVVSWRAEEEGEYALFLDLGGVSNWTTFAVRPDGWVPAPGLSGPRTFNVTTPLQLPLRRRWTGEAVGPAAVPPDQYLLGDIELDVYGDVVVDADGAVHAPELPWPDPLGTARRR